MKKIKVVSKTLMVNLEFPIEVGQVKMTAVCQAFVYKDKESGKMLGDFDFSDYRNTTYMDMPVDGYNGVKKLKEFHKELGIDLDILINKEFNKTMTDEFQKVFISTFDETIFKL
jgi:hypothetical protein